MSLKRFLIHILILIAAILLLLYLIMFGLGSYTNHGQQIEMPNYIGKQLDFAVDDANNRSFKVIVNDSIHKLNIPGGQILRQNPKPQSMVKENRKIYVTISKYTADAYKSDYLGVLYGKPYVDVERRLRNDDIFCEVLKERYDSGAPGMILEAYYNGRPLIVNNAPVKNVDMKRGDKLQFVISKNEGGEIALPDLVCKSLPEAKFNLSSSKLSYSIVEIGEITNTVNAYVIKQNPSIEQMTSIPMGESIELTISEKRPDFCN